MYSRDFKGGLQLTLALQTHSIQHQHATLQCNERTIRKKKKTKAYIKGENQIQKKKGKLINTLNHTETVLVLEHHKSYLKQNSSMNSSAV